MTPRPGIIWCRPAGGYTIAFVTGSVGQHDRLDALENTVRDCLGLPPLPADDT